MDLRSLRYFVTTVEVGTINGAALRCHVSQPSITMAIAKLEDEFSCTLFRRHRKGCTPTPEGERMYEMAKSLLHHAESIRNEFTRSEPMQRLRLSVDPTIRISAMNEVVDLIKEGASDRIQLELVADGQEADARLTSEPALKSGEQFLPLSKEYYALMLPHDNLLAYQSDLSLTDLDGQAIIERIHCEKQALFDAVVRSTGIHVETVARVDSEEWAQALVGMGLGICFAPLPEDHSDPRFVIRSISTLMTQDLPARWVGLAYRAQSEALLRRCRLFADHDAPV